MALYIFNSNTFFRNFPLYGLYIHTPKRATKCCELINKLQYYICDKNQYVLISQNIRKKNVVGIRKPLWCCADIGFFYKNRQNGQSYKGVYFKSDKHLPTEHSLLQMFLGLTASEHSKQGMFSCSVFLLNLTANVLL